MSNSLKLAVLFLWVLSAIYIKEDAKQKIRDHSPVASYDHKPSPSVPVNGDTVEIILTRDR